jgi:hypothetical protein
VTSDNLALRITQKAAQRFDFESATLAIESLSALGYTFVTHGEPGRFPYQSDEGRYALTKYVADKTKLAAGVVRDVLTTIDHFGLKIREPDAHPSGLDTTECAITPVRQLRKRQ